MTPADLAAAERTLRLLGGAIAFYPEVDDANQRKICALVDALETAGRGRRRQLDQGDWIFELHDAPSPIPLSTLFGLPIVEVDDIDAEASGPIVFETPSSGTLSGVWDDGRAVCAICQQPFTPGPEGTAVLTHTTTGESVGPICPACGIAIESPDA